MAGEQVVYVQDILCSSCGFHMHGYLQYLGDGRGMTVCPNCGASITQQLPPHSTLQLAPSDYESPVHPHARFSHYPGLYNQPKHAPRLDLADIVRIFYSPTKAFTSLYLSTNLQRALALVVVFSVLAAFAGTLVTASSGDVLNYNTKDVLELSFRGIVSWIVSLFAFLVFCSVAASAARGVFGGRGERSMTISLLGYCYPAYVVLTVILLSVFTVGFRGLDLTNIDHWTNSQTNQAVVSGVVLLVVLIAGLIGLLWVVSKAISVANDITTGEAFLTAIFAAIPAGLVFVVVGMVMRLPMGLIL